MTNRIFEFEYDIQKQFKLSLLVEADQTTIKAVRDEVTLTGTVASRAEWLTAKKCVYTGGVICGYNHIDVK